MDSRDSPGIVCILQHQCFLPVVGVTIAVISNTRANLSVPYNTPYNVSIVAGVCGQRNSTTYIELNYGKCYFQSLCGSSTYMYIIIIL